MIAPKIFPIDLKKEGKHQDMYQELNSTLVHLKELHGLHRNNQ